MNNDELSKYNLDMIQTKIDEGIVKIEKNLNEINQLIIEIEAEIEKCNYNRYISYGLSCFSGIITGLSIGNYLATKSSSSLFNSITNGGSTIINSVNFVRYSSLIKDLKILLENVKNEREAMLNSVNEIKNYLKEKLNKIINGMPKYY